MKPGFYIVEQSKGPGIVGCITGDRWLLMGEGVIQKAPQGEIPGGPLDLEKIVAGAGLNAGLLAACRELLENGLNAAEVLGEQQNPYGSTARSLERQLDAMRERARALIAKAKKATEEAPK